METISPDTSPEVARIQREIWRSMPGEKRLRLSLAWSSEIRRLALAGVQKRHPDYDDRQLKLAWFRKTMGDEAFFSLFPGEVVDW